MREEKGNHGVYNVRTIEMRVNHGGIVSHSKTKRRRRKKKSLKFSSLKFLSFVVVFKM